MNSLRVYLIIIINYQSESSPHFKETVARRLRVTMIARRCEVTSLKSLLSGSFQILDNTLLSLSHTPDMGMKPEVTKTKLWSNHKAEAQTQALTFWKHRAEAKDGAEVLLSYYKYPFLSLIVHLAWFPLQSIICEVRDRPIFPTDFRFLTMLGFGLEGGLGHRRC